MTVYGTLKVDKHQVYVPDYHRRIQELHLGRAKLVERRRRESSARVSRRRRRRGAAGAEGVGCGVWGGAVPLPINFFTFPCVEMAHLGYFGCKL